MSQCAKRNKPETNLGFSCPGPFCLRTPARKIDQLSNESIQEWRQAKHANRKKTMKQPLSHISTHLHVNSPFSPLNQKPSKHSPLSSSSSATANPSSSNCRYATLRAAKENEASTHTHTHQRTPARKMERTERQINATTTRNLWHRYQESKKNGQGNLLSTLATYPGDTNYFTPFYSLPLLLHALSITTRFTVFRQKVLNTQRAPHINGKWRRKELSGSLLPPLFTAACCCQREWITITRKSSKEENTE